MNSFLNSAVYFFRHPVARRRPVRSVLRFLRWQIACRRHATVEVAWLGGLRLVAARGMTGITGNIYYGLHEFHDMAAVLHVLRPGEVFADLGANVGSYTLLAAGIAGATTVSFEPNGAAADALERNVALNGLGARVSLVRAAVGAAAGEVRFTEDDGPMNRVSEDGAATVPMVALDGAVSGPSVIKMDVEGGERAVLHGAAETLRSAELLMVISESHDPAFCDAMTAAGFAKYTYDAFARRFSPLAGEDGNALFIRDIDRVQERVKTAKSVSVFGVVV